MLIEAPSILITDDDANFRATLQDVLEPQGYRTLLAADGEEALEIVRNEAVHLLLLDMHMPKLTGLETIQLVRQIKIAVPCILLSAAADELLVRQAQQVQVFTVLSKPVSRRVITRTVKLALETPIEPSRPSRRGSSPPEARRKEERFARHQRRPGDDLRRDDRR